MIKKLTFMLFLFTFALLAEANAQSAIVPEKQAAIKEMVALMNADNQTEQLIKVFSEQMQDTRRETVKAIIKERIDLTAADKKQLENMLLEEEKDKYKPMQQRLLAKIDYNTVIDEMMLEVYDKFFTLEEIRELIAFYKTPVGQKLLKQVPAIAAESMKVTQTKLLPRLMEALREIEQEDRRDIEQKIEARKPRPKKPATK